MLKSKEGGKVQPNLDEYLKVQFEDVLRGSLLFKDIKKKQGI
jgi:hypothetical protein